MKEVKNKHVKPASSRCSYLFGVGVEGHSEVQQQLPCLHPLDERLHAELQVSSCRVDLVLLALTRLRQLLCRFQELLGIGVCVLTAEEGGGMRGLMGRLTLKLKVTLSTTKQTHPD